MLFENEQKIDKKMKKKKNDDFSHFAKHRFKKKTVMLQPPS